MSLSNARVDAASDRRRPALLRGNGWREGQLEQPSAEQRAVRLLSETAHDLRSPLTTIRESVRLVRDGGAGPLSDEQRSFLATAIDQCDCVDQLVEELIQFDRLRTGVPRVRRQWVSIREVRHAVDETLRPWTTPRAVSIVWEGADDTALTTFADASILRRLIVNLIANAVRVTGEGDDVRIRLRPVRGGESVRWEIIDQGPGIDPARLQQISQHQVSQSEGEGIGLMISRQLAALHFSPLHVRSCVGTGTEVAFETPAGGPRSVAACWSRWRSSISAGGGTASQRPLLGESIHTRFDPPAATVALSHEGGEPKMRDRLVAGTVSLGAAVPMSLADRFDELLQHQQRLYDLVYRAGIRHWVWCFDIDERHCEQRMDMITGAARAESDGMRLHWSRPQLIPVDHRRLKHRLQDWLVRQTLAAPTDSDGDAVGAVTQPVRSSPIPAARLDHEVRWLVQRLTARTTS